MAESDAMVEAFQAAHRQAYRDARLMGSGPVEASQAAVRAGLAAVEAHRERTERERVLVERAQRLNLVLDQMWNDIAREANADYWESTILGEQMLLRQTLAAYDSGEAQD